MPSIFQDVSGMYKAVTKKKKDGKDSHARKLVTPVDNPDSDSEVFYADHISAVDLNDSQLVTLKLESRNYLHFQPDTGVQCTVIQVEYAFEHSSHGLQRL